MARVPLRSSLRVRLCLLVAACMTPAIVAIVLLGEWQARLAVDNLRQQLALLARMASAEHEAGVEGARQTLLLLSHLPQVRGGSAETCNPILSDLLAREDRYANFGVCDERGAVLASAVSVPPGVNLADRTWFRRAVETRGFSIGDYQVGRITGKPTINFGMPVLDEAGQVKRVVFAALSLSWLQGRAHEINLPSDVVLIAMDRGGTVLARYPDPEQWVGRSFPDSPLGRVLLEGAKEDSAETEGVDGERRLYAVHALGGHPAEGVVFLAIGASTDSIRRKARETELVALLIMALVVLAGLLVAWFSAGRVVVGKVHSMLGMTERVASGDLTARTGIAPSGELGLLARALDDMAVHLQEREAQLHRAEEAARHAQKMEAIGRLASGIAHDFNNLLTVINGTCDLILPRLGQHDPIRASIDQIRRAGEQSSGLTRQLLAISRKQPISSATVDVNQIVSGLVAFLQRTLGEAVKVVPRLSTSPAPVTADPGLLEQVFMNLAINARDAMPQGGRLAIETDIVDLDEAYIRQWLDLRPGRYAFVAMTDTGSGMTEEVRARIFEPFFTTKPVGKGTGLGLSIVYGIVKQLGGQVWVYSEVGRGTTFKIYLPVSTGPAPAVAPDVAPPPKRGGTEMILLVEDEEAVRAVARQFLQNDGYLVLEAADANQALEVARAHAGTIDLLLTDMGLPGMPGTVLAEEFRGIRPNARILFMTGYSEPPAEGSTREVAVIQKPFTPDALAKKVAEVLG